MVGRRQPRRRTAGRRDAGQLPITGAGDDAVDQLVRNALADITTFWQQSLPTAYDEPLPPLQGGLFSVDSRNLDAGAYPRTGIGCAGHPVDPTRPRTTPSTTPAATRSPTTARCCPG